MSEATKPFTVLLGLGFIFLGIAGFFTGRYLLWFEVDWIHNTIHILTGIFALISAGKGYSSAKGCILLLGFFYAAFAIVGFLFGGSIFGFFFVNTAANILHMGVAALCLMIGFSSRD